MSQGLAVGQWLPSKTALWTFPRPIDHRLDRLRKERLRLFLVRVRGGDDWTLPEQQTNRARTTLTRAREVPGDGLAQRHVRRLCVLADPVQQPPGRVCIEEGHRQPQHLPARAAAKY